MQNSSILNIIILLPEQLKIKLLENLETEIVYYMDERGEITTAFYGSGQLALTGESFFNQALF